MDASETVSKSCLRAMAHNPQREDWKSLTEDSSWRIVTGETGLTHSGPVEYLVSSSSFDFWTYLMLSENFHCKRQAMKGGVVGVEVVGMVTEEAHPLSMTRAATSSVPRESLASSQRLKFADEFGR
jgi:hypothetical protein